MLKSETYRNTEVVTSNRVKIIIMLYEGAINFLEVGKEKISGNDIPGKSYYLDKASAIISELACSLDKKAGKEIAENLEKLYNYMISQISEANIKNDTKPIDTVISLLKELKAGWEDVARKDVKQNPRTEGVKMAAPCVSA